MSKNDLHNIRSVLLVFRNNIKISIACIISIIILKYTNAFDKESIFVELILGIVLVMWAGNDIIIGVITRLVEHNKDKCDYIKYNEEKDAEKRRGDAYRELINDELTE